MYMFFGRKLASQELMMISNVNANDDYNMDNHNDNDHDDDDDERRFWSIISYRLIAD